MYRARWKAHSVRRLISPLKRSIGIGAVKFGPVLLEKDIGVARRATAAPARQPVEPLRNPVRFERPLPHLDQDRDEILGMFRSGEMEAWP